MTNQSDDTNAIKAQTIEKTSIQRNQLTPKMVRLNTLAGNVGWDHEDFDFAEADQDTRVSLEALGAEGPLQEMLASQLLSIHRLQQTSMAFAMRFKEKSQYHTNTAIKLANTFIQQVTLLNKLQGYGEQKVTVERVDVHSGGQAFVGNVNGYSNSDEVKK